MLEVTAYNEDRGIAAAGTSFVLHVHCIAIIIVSAVRGRNFVAVIFCGRTDLYRMIKVVLIL
jgi:hypothetical protein